MSVWFLERVTYLTFWDVIAHDFGYSWPILFKFDLPNYPSYRPSSKNAFLELSSFMCRIQLCFTKLLHNGKWILHGWHHEKQTISFSLVNILDFCLLYVQPSRFNILLKEEKPLLASTKILISCDLTKLPSLTNLPANASLELLSSIGPV